MSWHWWYLEDGDGTRWAVRVQPRPRVARRTGPGGRPRILFTSMQRQVWTPFPAETEESKLTQAEVRALLARAKAEA